jgi:two-component system, chemotaxis family, chemotaxis protein CheY
MRFLVIDDSMPMRRIVANVLARLGHTDVILAANGREAMKRIETEPIDFVITDWFMPEMSGIEFLRKLRETPATRDVPIVIITANASSDDVAQAVRLRVNGYVLKPFTAELLRERIDSICAAVAERRDDAAAEMADMAADEVADDVADEVADEAPAEALSAAS